MAWLCNGKTNAEFIRNLMQIRLFKRSNKESLLRVEKAMKAVDRAHYVLAEDTTDAYVNWPLVIGHGAVISPPCMHAYAADHLIPFLRPGARVLDIGSGSGYLTAVLHHLVSTYRAKATTMDPWKVVGTENKPKVIKWSLDLLKEDTAGKQTRRAVENKDIKVYPADGRLDLEDRRTPIKPGKIVGIEHVPELVDWSLENFKKDKRTRRAVERKDIEIHVGDGRLGYPLEGPYDAIHVGAGASRIPKPLIEQLASPGRMFIPVGTLRNNLTIYHIDKDMQDRVTKTCIMAGVHYVPLSDRSNQQPFWIPTPRDLRFISWLRGEDNAI